MSTPPSREQVSQDQAVTHYTFFIPITHPSEEDLPSECPICREPFEDEPQEEPVRLDLESCRHIFGRECFEQHIKSLLPWSNRCPICRAVWYSLPNPGMGMAYEQYLADVQGAFENWETPTAEEMGEVRDLLDMSRRVRDILPERDPSTEQVDTFIELAETFLLARERVPEETDSFDIRLADLREVFTRWDDPTVEDIRALEELLDQARQARRAPRRSSMSTDGIESVIAMAERFLYDHAVTPGRSSSFLGAHEDAILGPALIDTSVSDIREALSRRRNPTIEEGRRLSE